MLVSLGGAEGTVLAPRLWCLLRGPEGRLVHKAGGADPVPATRGSLEARPFLPGGHWGKWP